MGRKVPANEWPCMLKNTSLSLGRGVFRIKTAEDMKRILGEYRQNATLQAGIKATNDSILQYFTPKDSEYLAKPPINGNVPPFLFEHCVDLSLGWIEYCYEGCITEEGKLTHYAFTEELYNKNAAGLAYVTPPPSFPQTPKMFDKLEAYVAGYMKGLIERGYLRQFFNIEIWGYVKGDDIEFCFCEINPRCAHAYHIPYQIAYKTNLWGDNFNLVLNNEPPTVSPWSKWRSGDFEVSVQVLINIKGAAFKGPPAFGPAPRLLISARDTRTGDTRDIRATQIDRQRRQSVVQRALCGCAQSRVCVRFIWALHACARMQISRVLRSKVPPTFDPALPRLFAYAHTHAAPRQNARAHACARTRIVLSAPRSICLLRLARKVPVL